MPSSLALLCTGLFAGAAVYVSFVEHPARMLGGTRLALTEFAPSYKHGAVMQVTLSVLGTLAALAAWMMGAPALWLAGGLLLGTLIPFTLVVILPTNKRLLDPSQDKDSKLAEQSPVRHLVENSKISTLRDPLWLLSPGRRSANLSFPFIDPSLSAFVQILAQTQRQKSIRC